MDAGTNWAGNVTYRARELVVPRTLDELAQVMADADRVRILGSRHSFNELADTDGVLVSLAEMESGEIEVVDGRARVPGGARHGDLVPAFARHGVALANLASLPHLSVAGAVQTGTHGSGDAIGSLATQVAAVEIVTGRGELVRLARGDAAFPGTVVGLGSLGAVTHVELDVEPAYEVAQRVWTGVRWDAALSDLDALTGAGDCVSLFTTWADTNRIQQVWVKRRAPRSVATAPDGATAAGRVIPGFADGSGAAADLAGADIADAHLARFGGVPASGPMHPVSGADPTPCTEQGGVPGPWYDRLPHFRLEFTPSVGDEIQSEYLLPRADALTAFEALLRLGDRIAPLLHVSEVRTMAADDLWLSPAYQTPTVGIHFTWKSDARALRALLPDIEAALPPTARPHWGKVTTMDPAEIAARFPRWADFASLVARFDPDRKLVNDHLARYGL